MGSWTTQWATGLKRLTTGGAYLLPVAAVACLALIIVPLPPGMVDVLLTVSLGVALWLLTVALGAPARDSLGFLPHALVLFTLFRLALNLGTTRLILSTGGGGRVIEAFGQVMVGGSYLVGGVVFAIITVVQFLVIARGTSRVAEVTARFSLDGLPGRQRAIDNELAARVIDAAEARRRRTQLERESYLHGGLDGALRFIQGDALAGLLITLVNLLGGLAVGVLQLGLPLEEALRRFALLTIGDGLATQLPALLTATATGLIATRVAGGDPDARPGTELFRQLFLRPGLLVLVAGVLAVLAGVPQLPTVPFLVVALFLGLLALVGHRSRPPAPPQVLEPPLQPRLAMELGSGLAALTTSAELAEAAQGPLGRLSRRLGIPIPLPVIRPWLAGRADGYRILLDGAPLAEGTLPPQQVAPALALRLAAALLPQAGELVGVAETRRLLDRLGQEAADLTRAVVPERLEVATLAAVLRGLLRGGLPVTDLRGILEVLAAAPAELRDPELLVERVRAARRRWFTAQLADEQGRVPVWLVDPLVEEALGQATRQTPTEGTLRLDRLLLQDLRSALQRCTTAPSLPILTPAGDLADHRPILLAAPHIRRHLEQALAGRARVITGQELDPDLQVESLGVFGPG